MRVNDLLRTIDLFEQLSSGELDQLASRLHERELPAGEVLCRRGDPVDALFIVIDGSIELDESTESARSGSNTTQLTSGDFFGDTALISGEVHHATATAMTACRILELDKDDFEALVSTRPGLMRAMLAAVSRRAVEANRRLLADEPGAPAFASDSSISGRIYPVFSPRGGSGKTTVAVSLATRLAELNPQRVALLDLDLLFDDAALQLDLMPAASLASIPEAEVTSKLDPRTLSNYLVEHSSGLRVLVAAMSPEEGEQVTGAHVRAALAALKRQFLVTFVDCGSTFSEPSLAALESSDGVLILCTPELATLRDVRDCQRIFGQALHIDKGKFSYVLNHPLPSTGLTRAQFESALEHPMAVEIPYAGESSSAPVAAKAVHQIMTELRPPEAVLTDGSSRGSVHKRGTRVAGGRLRLWGSHAR